MVGKTGLTSCGNVTKETKWGRTLTLFSQFLRWLPTRAVQGDYQRPVGSSRVRGGPLFPRRSLADGPLGSGGAGNAGGRGPHARRSCCGGLLPLRQAQVTRAGGVGQGPGWVMGKPGSSPRGCCSVCAVWMPMNVLICLLGTTIILGSKWPVKWLKDERGNGTRGGFSATKLGPAEIFVCQHRIKLSLCRLKKIFRPYGMCLTAC